MLAIMAMALMPRERKCLTHLDFQTLTGLLDINLNPFSVIPSNLATFKPPGKVTSSLMPNCLNFLNPNFIKPIKATVYITVDQWCDSTCMPMEPTQIPSWDLHRGLYQGFTWGPRGLPGGSPLCPVESHVKSHGDCHRLAIWVYIDK